MIERIKALLGKKTYDRERYNGETFNELRQKEYEIAKKITDRLSIYTEKNLNEKVVRDVLHIVEGITEALDELVPIYEELKKNAVSESAFMRDQISSFNDYIAENPQFKDLTLRELYKAVGKEIEMDKR